VTLTLIATPGGLTSNVFLDWAAARAILDGVPNTSAWNSATSDEQDQALVYATTMLESIAYLGVKSTVSQALNWPRQAVLDPDYGQQAGAISGYMVGEGNWGVYLSYTDIPVRIQRATTLLALEILRAGTGDVWGVEPTFDVKRKKVDVLETEYQDPQRRRTGLRRYPSVWREIFPLTLASVPRAVERG
jgi:hypothetical protein